MGNQGNTKIVHEKTSDNVSTSLQTTEDEEKISNEFSFLHHFTILIILTTLYDTPVPS